MTRNQIVDVLCLLESRGLLSQQDVVRILLYLEAETNPPAHIDL